MSAETTKKAEYDSATGIYSFECPHCLQFVEVEKNQVNCSIFRHGYFFATVNNQIILTSQLGPHTSKEECDNAFSEGKIIGCGKPFRMAHQGADNYNIEICGYI
jgi:hypothetical protein